MKTKLPFLVLLVVLIVGSISSSALAESSFWKKSGETPSLKGRPAWGVIENQLYIAGGVDENGNMTNTVEHYDPKTNSWSSSAPMNTGRYIAAYGVINDKLYVVGGAFKVHGGLNDPNQLNTLEVFDPQANTWSNLASLSSTRHSTAGASLNNLFYVIGGASTDLKPLASVNIYNPETNQWSSSASLPAERENGAAVSFGNNIYYFGGINLSGTATKSVYSYDDSTKKWTAKKDMPVARYGQTTVVYNDKIYVIGGSNTSSVNQVDVYDPASDTWTTDQSFPTSRNYPFAASFNDKVYLFGGYVSSSISNLVESFPNNSEPDPTPAPSGDRAILTITMATGLDKEFDLSMEEVNAFISWYENKEAGSGTASYAIDKHENNKGPFSSRKDYVIFKNILSFEVDEYSTT